MLEFLLDIMVIFLIDAGNGFMDMDAKDSAVFQFCQDDGLLKCIPHIAAVIQGYNQV